MAEPSEETAPLLTLAGKTIVRCSPESRSPILRERRAPPMLLFRRFAQEPPVPAARKLSMPSGMIVLAATPRRVLGDGLAHSNGHDSDFFRPSSLRNDTDRQFFFLLDVCPRRGSGLSSK